MNAKPGSVTLVTGEPNHIPDCLRAIEQPGVTDILVVDERVVMMQLFRCLASGGYSVINNRAGKLVITKSPGDFR